MGSEMCIRDRTDTAFEARSNDEFVILIILSQSPRLFFVGDSTAVLAVVAVPLVIFPFLLHTRIEVGRLMFLIVSHGLV